MVEKVTMYKAEDGQIFSSETEAEYHDKMIIAVKDLKALIEGEFSWYDEENIIESIIHNRNELHDILKTIVDL